MNKILTLDQLVDFCSSQNLLNFDSNETGYRLCVHVPSTFEKFEEKNTETMMFGKVKLIHTNRNRNGSNVTKEAAEKCLSTIKYKPLLANFCELDNGEKDFTSHDFSINEDGSVDYIEHQIGCFTVDEPYMEYDEEKDRYYVYAYVAIPVEYSPATKIIERKGGTKISAEIAVNKMSYDAEKKELLLEDIEILGATALGTNPETGEEVQEGMEGARLDIADFALQEKHIDANDKLIETLEKLNTTLSQFNIDTARKEDAQMENEIKDMEVTDEIEAVEMEEVEMEEVTEIETTEDEVTEVEENFEEENPETEDAPVVVEQETEEVVEPDMLNCSFAIGSNVRNFSVSMNAKLEALTNLVNDTYADDLTFYFVEVFDEDRKVVMVDYWSGKAYRQTYKVKNDVFTLTGDRCEVFATWMTAEEQKAFDKLKADFSELNEKFEDVSGKLEKYEIEPEKVKVLNSEDYAQIAETAEFKELSENHFDMSVDEVRDKADSILLSYAKKGALNFASENKVETGKINIPVEEVKTNNRYGNLFNK